MFVHIPKTGGTSIRKGRTESSFRLYEPAREWGDLPSFAVVRDPFDRVESAWRDFRWIRPQTQLGFEDFVKAVNLPAWEDRIEDPATAEHHAAPMVHEVHGLKHAAFVCRYERLQDDFNRFCRVIGIPSFDLPHLRKAAGVPRAERTENAVRLVEKLYADDYSFLGALP
jgi:hypothetical protein